MLNVSVFYSDYTLKWYFGYTGLNGICYYMFNEIHYSPFYINMATRKFYCALVATLFLLDVCRYSESINYCFLHAAAPTAVLHQVFPLHFLLGYWRTLSSVVFLVNSQLGPLSHFLPYPNEASGLWTPEPCFFTKCQACRGKGLGWGGRNMSTRLCYWIHERGGLSLLFCLVPYPRSSEVWEPLVWGHWAPESISGDTSSAQLCSLQDENA